MKTLFYICIFAFLLPITGCKDNKPKPPERIPEAEIAAYKDAIIKIYPYIVLEDSAYHITLSKEDAMNNMHVPEKYYDRMVQDLEYTNYIVREEYNKKGIPIEMPEPLLDNTYHPEVNNTLNNVK